MDESVQNFSQWRVVSGVHTVELAPGVVAPTSVTATGPYVPDGDALPLEIRITSTYDRATRAYVLREVSVSAPEGAGLTGTALRQIPPQRLMRWAIPRTFRIDMDELSPAVLAFIDPVSPHLDRAMLADATLEDAVAIYRIAEAISEAPTKAVADALGIPMRTVRDRMRRARERELLEHAETTREIRDSAMDELRG